MGFRCSLSPIHSPPMEVRIIPNGEALDPELSNLTISTVAAGLHPTTHTSIELVYHKYQRIKGDSPVYFSLDAAPVDGKRSLGQEIDLIIGMDIGSVKEQ